MYIQERFIKISNRLTLFCITDFISLSFFNASRTQDKGKDKAKLCKISYEIRKKIRAILDRFCHFRL
ncbi:hypothetical protein EsVE80_05180 [Enterococcus saigonensis]|uniref:Uncharacterized protein n=1 Tax=Enterococcus saigonensis TaxID=1805431 RepID=A0A679II43_9ENTE|nr:hypothetical protein EsVE80_05180 [Enterococcus saigonensis]